jgi:hypothetical protein
LAILLDCSENQEITLHPQHIFGRRRGVVTTELSDDEISRVHATISWNGAYWLLQDTSTNGSYINGKHIQLDAKHRLSQGDEIHFGSLKTTCWRLLNIEAPKSMLVPQQSDQAGQENIALSNVVMLPSEEHPELILYQSLRGTWVYESADAIVELNDGDQIKVQDSVWFFVDATPMEQTKAIAENEEAAETSKVEINFKVSQNEEHVSLMITVDDLAFDLGNRIHHYLLLLLARQRICDRETDFCDKEQGWIDKDQLCKIMGLEETHINTQIYRFRKQIIEAMTSTNMQLQVIERRRGEIRFAFNDICINGVSANLSAVTH